LFFCYRIGYPLLVVSSPSATRSHPKSATIIGFLLSLQFKRFVQCCSIPAGKNHGN